MVIHILRVPRGLLSIQLAVVRNWDVLRCGAISALNYGLNYVSKKEDM
jgi:hypothetical protein